MIVYLSQDIHSKMTKMQLEKIQPLTPYCVVPENIHTPPTEGFLAWTPHPSGNSILVPHFPLKYWAFETQLPLEFPLTFLGVGMDIFWKYTLNFNDQQPDYTVAFTLLSVHV